MNTHKATVSVSAIVFHSVSFNRHTPARGNATLHLRVSKAQRTACSTIVAIDDIAEANHFSRDTQSQVELLTISGTAICEAPCRFSASASCSLCSHRLQYFQPTQIPPWALVCDEVKLVIPCHLLYIHTTAWASIPLAMSVRFPSCATNARATQKFFCFSTRADNMHRRPSKKAFRKHVSAGCSHRLTTRLSNNHRAHGVVHYQRYTSTNPQQPIARSKIRFAQMNTQWIAYSFNHYSRHLRQRHTRSLVCTHLRAHPWIGSLSFFFTSRRLIRYFDSLLFQAAASTSH